MEKLRECPSCKKKVPAIRIMFALSPMDCPHCKTALQRVCRVKSLGGLIGMVWCILVAFLLLDMRFDLLEKPYKELLPWLWYAAVGIFPGIWFAMALGTELKFYFPPSRKNRGRFLCF